MGSSDEHYRFQFERLLRLHEEGPREEFEELCHKVLVRGQDMIEPLADFLVGQKPHPRLAVLLELLGKIGDPRSAAILVHHLDSRVRELRIQAAIALGWLRARVALEKLDALEGADPDEEVRREASIAVEEILREYPAFRPLLKNHRAAVPDEERLDIGDDEDADVLYPVSPETHKQLAALFPRVLALRYRAVPLAFEAAGTVVFAVLAGSAPQTIGADLKRLTGREVELRAWPEQRLFDRLLSFYKWGDDDWVKLGQELPAEARREIAGILFAKVDPGMPNAPLSDCVDSLEAVQSFLSLCIREQACSAAVDYDRAADSLRILVQKREGPDVALDPPAAPMREFFHRALLILAGCRRAGARVRGVAKGRLRFEPVGGASPCIVDVTHESLGTKDRLRLEFVDPGKN